MTIHKEGYTPIALCILFIFVVNAFLQFYFPSAFTIKWIVYILSFLFFVGTIWFYRNPSIDIATDEANVLSPADGKIIAIDEIEEKDFLKGRSIRVSIALSPTNVHVTRNPVTGTVKNFSYKPEIRQTDIAVENGTGTALLLRQTSGLLSKSVIIYIKQGDAIEQGSHLGFANLGSRIDMFLPIGTTLKVDVNEIVRGGRTVLATLKG